jgi:hypothetical protein
LIVRSRSIDPIPVSDVWDFTVDVPEQGDRSSLTITEDEGIEVSLDKEVMSKETNARVTVVGGERLQVKVRSGVGTLEFFGKEPVTWSQQFGREYCLDEDGCRCGVDDSVDSGLEHGGRELLVAAGSLEAETIEYDIEIPREVFGDGHWEGTITTTSLRVAGPGIDAARSSFEAPFEFTVENGAVTSGSFEITFGAQSAGAEIQAVGVVTISGTFTGCGFAPQMMGLAFHFAGTISAFDTIQEVEFNRPAGGHMDTVWEINPATTADIRNGTIDEGGMIGAISAGGMAVLDVHISFDARRTAG